MVFKSFTQILQDMMNNLTANSKVTDMNRNSVVRTLLEVLAYELDNNYYVMEQLVDQFFIDTAVGSFLEMRAGEYGVIRKPGTKATGTVTASRSTPAPFSQLIPLGTVFETEDGTVQLTSTADVTININATSIPIPVEAVVAGSAGNLQSGLALKQVGVAISLIEQVTVASPGLSGGTDGESDDELRARLLGIMRQPSTSGNKADYLRWAMEVTGVGGVSVIPVRDGPGTVSVAIIDSSKAPANQALVDAVQNYIAPPWVNTIEAETMTIGGFGASIDATLIDDNGDSVKMVYNAGGSGTVTHVALQTILQQPGIWQVKPLVKVDSLAGAVDLLQIGVWNVSANAWAKTKPAGTVDALLTLKASDLTTVFAEKILEFYWNGQEQLELRVTRLTTDTTTTVWLDRIVYRSTFSQDTGMAKAPVGARVTVEPAKAVLISIAATLTIAAGYNAASVKAAVQQNIDAYIKSLAFASDNDVRYVRIGQVILDTPGVQDYSGLVVNGGTANIVIADQEVAVMGSVTLT